MARQYILAIDEGTTGTTALVMDQHLRIVAQASEDFEQHFPQPGWVEHDLNQVWAAVLATLHKVSQQVDLNEVAAIGITNQRETLCFWDRETSEPLGRAIVWQDRRTQELCEQLRGRGMEPFFQDKTGLLLDPYFSGTKAAWALKHWGDVREAHKAGRLAVGTIESYLVWRLSGGSAHITEPSNASRTLCFDLHKLKWDAELFTALGVPADIWPEVRHSTGVFAHTRGVPGLADGTPITGILGDQQAALLGQACIQEGMAKCTYGTGAFLLMNTGKKPVKSRHRLLTTVAWAMGGGEGGGSEVAYALEGSAFIAGAAVQWLRDGLGLIQSADEIEALAARVESTDGVVFVPALTGLGAPHWNASATGLFTGLTRGTRREHLARAVLEGIAFQNVDLLEAMQKDLGKPMTSVNVDGGASANTLLMEFQANVLGVKLRRPQYLETTSLGAVFAAGLGAGIWTSLDQVEQSWKMQREFLPEWSQSQRDEALQRWKKAVAKALL